MSEAVVLGAMDGLAGWGAAVTLRPATRQPAPAAKPRQKSFNAWLSAEEVANMLLAGEFVEAGVPVPRAFAPLAIESALSSVERWTREGRIFSIHDLYPRYQFDAHGRPHPTVERAIEVLGSADPLRVGNWFTAPNAYLNGRRPQELLAIAPGQVLRALEHS